MRDWKREVGIRLAGLDIAPARLAGIVEEVGQHLEERWTRLVAAGRPEEEADRLVLQDLSDSDVFSREVKRLLPTSSNAPPLGAHAGSGWIAPLWQDVRYGIRTLRRNPAFTAVAALTLSLGIGASTAVFTVANTVMLRPLPFRDPHTLVRLWESNPAKGWPTFSASQPTFLDWQAQSRSFERLAAQTNAGFTLTASGNAEIVRAIAVSADFLPLLGVDPMLGRNFRPEEDRPGGHTAVTLLTHAFWQREFGSNPALLGTSIQLDGRPFDIIGVLPPSFRWGNRTDLVVPLAPDPSRSRADHRLLVVGRLAPNVSLDQARTEINGIAARLGQRYPESNAGWSVRVSTFYDWLIPEDTRKALAIFMGAVALVLLIACGNVASLMLARAAAREREISIRVALGAHRLRILSQLLVEATLVAFVAGLFGLIEAWGAIRLLIVAGPAVGLPRLDELSLDGTVFGFAFVTSTLSGVFFGLVPALHASRPNVNHSLKEAARGTQSASRQRLRSMLVIGEVALSVSLLVGAGLLVRSVQQLEQVDPGFAPGRLATMRVNLPQTTYNTPAKSKEFYERLLPVIATLPEVQSVATSSGVPLSGGNTATEVTIAGKLFSPGVPLSADWRLVSPGYFTAMGIPLRGRDFDRRDEGTPDKPVPVTIISESMARRYWPGEDPIGHTVVLHSFSEEPQRIIGVAGDVRSAGLDIEARPMVYGSAMAIAGWNPMALVIRTADDPLSHVSSVREAIRQIDPTVPIFDVRALDDLVTESFGSRRFNMYLIGCFAAAAAALSCVGLFGTLAYLVSQRTRDIGIRLALGAGRRDVIRMIVGRGMVLALSGAALGLIVAFGAARLMKSLLFSVSPWDPVTFAAVPLLLAAVSLMACYLPARRATRVDPVIALRSE